MSDNLEWERVRDYIPRPWSPMEILHEFPDVRIYQSRADANAFDGAITPEIRQALEYRRCVGVLFRYYVEMPK